MDVSMPKMDGLEAAEHISHTVPRAKVLLCTLHLTSQLAPATAFPGVRGVVDKQNAVRELPDAVETVLHGETYFPHGLPTGR
jgi:two-component system nitrate/nitrite response regulator NarL